MTGYPTDATANGSPFLLSVDGSDLPAGYLAEGRSAFRSMTIDGREIEFSEGFTDLHTRLHEEVLALSTAKGSGATRLVMLR